MKKKILSIMLILALLVCLLPVTHTFAADEQFTLKIVPSVTNVNKGSTEEITYTVIGQGNSATSMSGITTELEIPAGLTYIEGSGEIIEIAGKIQNNLDGTEFVEDTMKGIFIFNLNPFQLTEETAIATFKCSVNSDASGVLEVKATNVVITNGNYDTVSNVTTINAVTNVVTPVTGITLNKTTLQLNAGSSETLIASLQPDGATSQSINWKSNDTTVATVNNGTVTGISGGTAIITATTADGNHSASCQVTVNCIHENTTTHPAVASTCLVQGNEAYETCDACGVVVSGSDEKLPLADHNYGELIEKVEPTHTETTLADGMEAHYECSVCGKLFNENKEEVTEEELIIDAPLHTYEGWVADTNNHWQECGCGNIVEQEPHKGGEATCVNKAECEVCNLEYGELNPENHVNTETRDAVEATTETEGYTGDVYCLDCGKLVKEGEVIPVITADPEEPTEESGTTESTEAETEEVEPETVEDNNVTTDTTKPQTDDNSNMTLWISLLVISGISFIMILKCNIKRKIGKHLK